MLGTIEGLICCPQVEATGDNVPAPISSFDEASLPPALAANTVRCNYTKPTPVQKYSIPIGLAHRDLMACAQTGSGKTAAFCFPIIANILASAVQPTGRSRKAYPLALVLSPTRELSSQIYDEARKFTYQTGIRPVVVYGGAPVMNQVGLLPGITAGRPASRRPLQYMLHGGMAAPAQHLVHTTLHSKHMVAWHCMLRGGVWLIS